MDENEDEHSSSRNVTVVTKIMRAVKQRQRLDKMSQNSAAVNKDSFSAETTTR